MIYSDETYVMFFSSENFVFYLSCVSYPLTENASNNPNEKWEKRRISPKDAKKDGNDHGKFKDDPQKRTKK